MPINWMNSSTSSRKYPPVLSLTFQHRLDPRGMDGEIEATTFRKELVKWASDIQDAPADGQGGGAEGGEGGGGKDKGDDVARNVAKEQRRKSIHDLTQSIITRSVDSHQSFEKGCYHF